MVIAKSPMRLAFFGGGTDFHSYFKEHQGAVIATSFDKYAYVTARRLPPFFSYNSQIHHSEMERVLKTEDISHNMVREAMKICELDDLHICFDTDLPSQSGLGTSSAFSTSLLLA